MYLIVYLFSWFAFYYFPELFEFDNLLNVNTDTTEQEKLCSSMIQCYLTMLSYGVRSGGGIGDVLPKLSYKVNPGYFVAGFFFVVLFHIFVIWIMINLFFIDVISVICPLIFSKGSNFIEVKVVISWKILSKFIWEAI